MRQLLVLCVLFSMAGKAFAADNATPNTPSDSTATNKTPKEKEKDPYSLAVATSYTLAKTPSSTTPALIARLIAIDTLGEVGANSQEAASRLQQLVALIYTTGVSPDDKSIFAIHVIHALGKCGWRAQGMVGDLANIAGVDPALTPIIQQAVSDIVSSKAPTPTQAPLRTSNSSHQTPR